MKRIVVLFITLFVGNLIYSQKTCPSRDAIFNQTFTLCNVERFSSSIYVKGETAFLLLDRLIGVTRQPAYKYNIKKVNVPGIYGAVKFKILVGVHGYMNTSNSTYFHYYKNEKQKNSMLNSLEGIKKEGITIRFNINGSDVISKTNMNLLLTYVKSLV